jgi:hypothetical protein
MIKSGFRSNGSISAADRGMGSFDQNPREVQLPFIKW